MVSERVRKFKKVLCLLCTFNSSLSALIAFDTGSNVKLYSALNKSAQEVGVLEQNLHAMQVGLDEFSVINKRK